MNLQQSPQQNSLTPLIQECVDAITEHQRLIALVKGEWVKGLLPQSSVRADYTVQRIHGNYIHDMILLIAFWEAKWTLLCYTTF